MTPAAPKASRETWLWIAVVIGLLLLRVPSVVQPAGSDQSLYMYVADRILAGGAPYVDAWDQKPPGVHFVYAAVRAVWPHASAVPAADLLASAGVAAWLVVLGRRTIGVRLGFVAAVVFLVLGDPSIARLGGLYVRGQCEVFIALAVVAALGFAWRPAPRPHQLVLAGVCLGLAVWLKYNAAAYALPVLAALMWPPQTVVADPKRILVSCLWVAAGSCGVSLLFLGFLALHGALPAWWLATIDYNLAYAGETYNGGLLGAAWYLVMLPIDHMQVELLWFLGGVGALLVAVLGRQRGVSVVALAWAAAAIASIALNGARGLPQYFVQARPALAFLFVVGLSTLVNRPTFYRGAVAALVLVGLWRVGTDPSTIAGLRWGGVPQAFANLEFDMAYLHGSIDRQTYLSHFKGQQKYDALETEELAKLIRDTTHPNDRILVFGFAPAVYLESQRLSASRLFWSRPVVLEFAADRPGYGSRGLLADLEAARPAMVALQKQDWGPGEPNSMTFALETPHLRDWLTSHYVNERDTPFFSIWRRRP